jgi:hypothetical protein
MSRGVLLFDYYLADIRLIDAVALARHPCSALATKLLIPRTIRMVLEDPSYPKTDRTMLIHWPLRDVVFLPADAVGLV